MLPVAYDPTLVVASVLVAVMAAYTGLRVTTGIAALSAHRQKIEIAKAAVALGGGIWSMHFVAMLAVSLPVPIEYDALRTLGSVLIAILITGLGLIALHAGEPSPGRLVAAGTMTGLGIVSMHYVGMSAIGGTCMPLFAPEGYVISTMIAIGASIGAFWLAYRERPHAHLALGAVALGLAISAMHYSAMIYTRFSLLTEIVPISEPTLTGGVLAMIVAVAAFVICGLFLLTALPLGEAPAMAAAGSGGGAPPAMPRGLATAGVGRASPPAAPASNIAHRTSDVEATASPFAQPARVTPTPEAGVGGVATAARTETAVEARSTQPTPPPTPGRLPYELNNTVRFVALDDVSAIRADGHYTWLRRGDSELFCPWSISKLETLVDAERFVRTHRSHLVNIAHVTGFSRDGDKAFCLIGESDESRVPVSRTRVADIRRLLGME
ncbi:MHYT domain-containing protein [Pseudoxanthobacter sp. M-2]|uniref:MHYT domain-containing protein n=1 Tax=Pseudoxanthobacter sp. M-2 TaxID=3078754 RepID=UPI0038FCD449